MKKLVAEVIGPNPPCHRCTELKRIVEKVALKLKGEGIEVEIKKADIMSREILGKYGLILSPALAVNGVLKTTGWIPDELAVETILRESIK